MSSSGDVAIEAHNLTKVYKLYKHPIDVFWEVIFRRRSHEEFYALQDVGFTVRRGEIVGLIGANGAGKSTLLKVLCGRVDSTGGSFNVVGKINAILELGTGFHEEYTGRENIFMGGLCLGYSRKQMEERLDWIIEFTGLHEFIDRQFRTYSSGMKARLTFAVAFCMRPDILIVDEALSVGDIAFVNRCTNHIIELCKNGSTAVVVSHNMFLVERLCHRALYFKRGRIVAEGNPLVVCKQYEKDMLTTFVEDHAATAGGASLPPPEHTPNLVEQAPAAAANVQATQETAPSNGVEPLVVNGADPIDVNGFVIAALPWAAAEGEPCGEREVNGEVTIGWVRVPGGKERAVDFRDSPAVLASKLVELIVCRVCDEVGSESKMFRCGQTIEVRAAVFSRLRKRKISVGLQIYSKSGLHISTTSSRYSLNSQGDPNPVDFDLGYGKQTFLVRLPNCRLAAGEYVISLAIAPTVFHFSSLDLLCQEARCAAFGVFREDLSQSVLYEPTAEWSRV